MYVLNSFFWENLKIGRVSLIIHDFFVCEQQNNQSSLNMNDTETSQLNHTKIHKKNKHTVKTYVANALRNLNLTRCV